MAQRKLTFGLLDSRMFNEFDGEWRMQFNSRKVCFLPNCVCLHAACVFGAQLRQHFCKGAASRVATDLSSARCDE